MRDAGGGATGNTRLTSPASARAGRRFLPALPPDDLWQDPTYRRLWLSILIGALGGQITPLALALTAAVSLQASATQIGTLGAVGVAPYVLLLLPAGVWLDRVRKLPVYVAGETVMALVLASVPLAWAFGRLNMPWLYGVAFVAGCVSVTSGTAAQIVLTQIVTREQLVEAHAKNRLAGSLAELFGPGAAGALIKLAGAPLALLINGILLLASVRLLNGLRIVEVPAARTAAKFWPELMEGLRFVLRNRLLISLAMVVGLWQVCQTAAMVVQVLFATRELGLSEFQFALCFTGAGLGTVIASSFGRRISGRIGPGPCLVAGIALSGIGWLQLAGAPAGTWGVIAFVAMLFCFSAGTVLIFSNMLALRQAMTPAPLLARMTSTMRWMTLFPAGPGSLLGGWLGEQFGLRHAMAFGGIGALALAAWVWRYSIIRRTSSLPAPAAHPADNGQGI
ncbi:MAG: MFS transporter [Rhodocyclaceae bacterium]|nr:MFS transporter [Rhodocyclaceae bacterium]